MPILPILAAACLSVSLDHQPEMDLAADAGSWTQWRGPSRDGQFSGPDWPDRLRDERTRLLWRVDGLSPSYCGPIVSEDRVFTAGTLDKSVEVVRAYERDSGDLLWQTQWEGSVRVPFFAAKNGSWMRSTPTFDGERLYVAGMRDVLVCLAGDSGEILWQVDFVSEFDAPPPDFGFVCSPLVTDEHVYVQAGASLCKLNKRTGEIIWRALKDKGGMFGSAFSSPIKATLAGRDQIVVLSRTHMSGVEPESGAVLWTTPVKAFRGMNILTPVVANDGILTATYGGRTQLLKIRESESELEAESVWNNRIQGNMTSPVIFDGHAYFLNRSNRFCCVRLSDGEIAWISPPTGDDYWSLIAQSGRILALSDSGLLRLVEATPSAYTLIDETSIADAQTWAHLAVAGSHIVVREQNALALYDWK